MFTVQLNNIYSYYVMSSVVELKFWKGRVPKGILRALSVWKVVRAPVT